MERDYCDALWLDTRRLGAQDADSLHNTSTCHYTSFEAKAKNLEILLLG